jgi:hypothetical protein
VVDELRRDDGAEGAVVAGAEEDVDGVLEPPGGADHEMGRCVRRPDRLGRDKQDIRLAESCPSEEGEDTGAGR